MRRLGLLCVLASGCSAATVYPSSVTVLAGAYSAVSINGSSLPVATTPMADGAKQEIVADRLWIGGAAGRNGVIWRVVVRTTREGVTRTDSTTQTGVFDANLATAQTTFGTISASGRQLTLKGLDKTTRVYLRED